MEDKQLIKIDTGYLFSNGIAVQHSSENKPVLLIVAETGTKTLHAYDIVAPGKVAHKREWAKLPGENKKYFFFYKLTCFSFAHVSELILFDVVDATIYRRY